MNKKYLAYSHQLNAVLGPFETPMIAAKEMEDAYRNHYPHSELTDWDLYVLDSSYSVTPSVSLKIEKK